MTLKTAQQAMALTMPSHIRRSDHLTGFDQTAHGSGRLDKQL
jgi:hypothetical protein